jgi:23S rRNA (guanosine2251-2'-O)-methyltransferase
LPRGMYRKRRNEELDRLSAEQYRDSDKQPVLLVLDNIRSLHNVGAAFRTADAFRIEGIILCGVTGQPPDREIEKTALGATKSVHWDYFPDTKEAIGFIRQKGYRVYAIEQTVNSTLLNRVKSEEKMAIIFGNEVYGVDQHIIDLCDGVIEIPQAGTKHSLNVSVSIGIVLWELVRAKFNHD